MGSVVPCLVMLSSLFVKISSIKDTVVCLISLIVSVAVLVGISMSCVKLCSENKKVLSIEPEVSWSTVNSTLDFLANQV